MDNLDKETEMAEGIFQKIWNKYNQTSISASFDSDKDEMGKLEDKIRRLELVKFKEALMELASFPFR